MLPLRSVHRMAVGSLAVALVDASLLPGPRAFAAFGRALLASDPAGLRSTCGFRAASGGGVLGGVILTGYAFSSADPWQGRV